MRLIIGYFLSLCFLLLGGNAHAHKTGAARLSAWTIENTIQAELVAMQTNKTPVCDVPASSSGKIADRIKATEIDEEGESGSFRKLLETGISRITVFYTLSAGSSLPSHFRYLPFSAHAFSASADRYIVHRVIRI
ncbi:hypothetical protein HGH93_06535 [Chitinophaga polysaccharea]|uniref:hypothetical protein n=1 Tax=Chitinophaga TaxID=79328 RepID=UPI00145592AF|nr:MULTISPECIES: hypothetical protein [Chitinophaga]NLR57747.1 hypothetical protein [Chitinophaga polysaccharea]NLU93341.1 hypothetical protein [Chitinophaga sp. Ak27]